MNRKVPNIAMKPDISTYVSITRSVTPTSQSRINERVSNSPLKIPLEMAINRALRNNCSSGRFSQSKSQSRMREKDSSGVILARNIYREEFGAGKAKYHKQTYNFINKYFDMAQEYIPIQSLIAAIMEEYQSLWGSENSAKIFEDFNSKLFWKFGENVSSKQLCLQTKSDGMIGLILKTFKEIKSEQAIKNSPYSLLEHPKLTNLQRSFSWKLDESQRLADLKNVIQQFMEAMYECMESEIYGKFNVEMRRMIVKYRQAERIMRRVADKVTAYADIFDLDSHFQQRRKDLENQMCNLKKQNERLAYQVCQIKNNLEAQQKQNLKVLEENLKLKLDLERYQHAVLLRMLGSNRPETYAGGTYLQPIGHIQEPFKITIDTHIIQKMGEAPVAKSYAKIEPLLSQNISINVIQNSQSKQCSLLENSCLYSGAQFWDQGMIKKFY